jgi:hypothetical protein|tara:strand:+ start:670 stop:1539 length:870 start_codon:yes stop_codon:yes gene_type:complete
MSESALALDSGAEDSSPDVGSSQDQSTESSLELFTDDSLDSAQSEDSGHSDAQSDFDPQRHDWLRGSADDVPEQYQPLVPLAKNMQAQFTRTQQDLAEQRRQIETQQGEWANRVQNLVTPQQQQVDPVDAMRANLSEDEARGVDAVEQIIQHRVGNVVNNLNSQVQQLQQQLSTANNYVQGQQTAYIANQVGEARQAYGGDLDAYTDQIVATTKITNPVTGSAYTVREAYELHAGITAQKASDLRGANNSARKSSKRSVRGTQGVDATEGSGPLSDSDVLSGLSKLGFE